MEDDMLENYDIESLNPRKNPYAKKLKKTVTINLSVEVIDYFKEMVSEFGIPYQTLINLYLENCRRENKKPEIFWK